MSSKYDKVRNYCNNTLSLDDEYKEIFGKELPKGKMFCPFHDNKDTPAAKRYDGSIVCFSCNRTYRVFDLLYKFNYGKVRYIMENVVIEDSGTETTRKTAKNYDIIEIDRNSSIGNILNKLEEVWQKRNLG